MRDFSRDVERVINAGVRTLFYNGDAVRYSLGTSPLVRLNILVSRI